MSNANVRVDTQGGVLRSLALDITRALEHISRELSNLDWHPADTMAGQDGGKGTPTSPTERVALARARLTGAREDIQGWITALEAHTATGRQHVDNALRIRGPSNALFEAADYGERCRYADCTNWASDHRVQAKDHTVIHDWCDEHWLNNACHIHGTHEHENRRVDGLRCCQNAYRQHQRETMKDIA